MSPRSAAPATPAAAALAERVAVAIGAALRAERERRRWNLQDVAARARVALSTVSGIEAGRRASLDTYARLAVALGLTLDVALESRRRRPNHQRSDLVHAAMGELWASWLHGHGHHVEVDHPYQHYQFAGRADVLAWRTDPPALLHIEDRTRFPDLQHAAGSYNAKRQYLAQTVARKLGIRRFASETHVMAGLWSSEVIHSVRLRSATFRSLCPDPDDRLTAWLSGRPPISGHTSTFVLLDPFASGRQARAVGLARVLAGTRPRMRGYQEAAERLSAGDRGGRRRVR
jgi:hypothetical protein